MDQHTNRLAGSFRDPSGFLFWREGILYRQINQVYKPDYEQLLASGLYDRLVASDQLIPHQEVELAPVTAEAYKILLPDLVPFISYPYEWSFSQLKDAALLTLRIQKEALAHDLTLKDASAYNVQFHRGRPVLIDTLSFARYEEGRPWSAYRQFCQHFLAPLALMAYVDVRLAGLLRSNIDGIPLDLATRLLPFRSRLSPTLQMHLHLHARAQRHYAGKEVKWEDVKRTLSRNNLVGLLDTLESAVMRLRWSDDTEWGDYYDSTNYSAEAFEQKRSLVSTFLDGVARQAPLLSVWDLGANTGVFSRLASERGFYTIAFDVDPGAVESNYLQARQQNETDLLPLLLDLTNPSPGLGWANEERRSLRERGPAGVILALALIHHLAIGNNVPLPQIAAFLADLCHRLIIEFVPKSDSQVERMLAMREDIFYDYTRSGFEDAFAPYFSTVATEPLSYSDRCLYLMEKRAV